MSWSVEKKDMNKKIIFLGLFVILFQITVNCYMIGEPIETQKNSLDSTKMLRKEGIKKMETTALGVISGCKEYRESGLNAALNWAAGFTNNCSDSDQNFNWNVGCADKMYVKKRDVDKCILMILVTDCKNWQYWYFSSFAYCSSILGGSGLPMLFF